MDLDFKYTYKTMPKSEASTSGMKVIEGDMSYTRAEIKSEHVTYKGKNGKDLHIRFVYPDYFEEEKKYPVICHIQGSAWYKQDLDSHILDFKDLVTNGYILAIIEYSSLPDNVFPSQVEDAKLAIRFINEHAEKLNIDTNNIFLSGDSSGGHTALLCWATWNNGYFDSSQNILPSIKGCIDLYGVVDFITIAEAESGLDHNSIDSPETLLLNGKLPGKNKEIAEKASVLYYLQEPFEVEVSPLIIFHGNKDKVVPFEQSIQLYEHCKEMNLEADFYCVNNADHGGNVFYCKEVINTIIGFLKSHTE